MTWIADQMEISTATLCWVIAAGLSLGVFLKTLGWALRLRVANEDLRHACDAWQHKAFVLHGQRNAATDELKVAHDRLGQFLKELPW